MFCDDCENKKDGLFVSICEECATKQDSELTRLQGDIEYVRDRLISRDDVDRDTIGIRDLIDEATNKGDFFPSSELKRRKEQIHEINRHFGDFQEFNAEVIADVKRLHAIIQHHRPLLCGRCGDAVHDTGNVHGCGYPLCECGDDRVLTTDTTDKRAAEAGGE